MSDSREISTRLRLVDSACLVTVLVLGLTALASAYGGWSWLLAGGAGVLGGLTVALVAERRGLGPWPVALLLVAVYFVVGSAVAVPDYATASVLPNLDTLRVLASASTTAWRDSLTGVTPLGSADTVLVVPWVIGLLGALASALVLWRTRHEGWVLVPLAAAFTAAAGFGDVDAGDTVLRGAVLAVTTLTWLRWRSLRTMRVQWVRRTALAGVVLLVAGAGAAGLTVVTGVGGREVLREEVTPPFDPLAYKSPLSAYRGYLKDDLKVAELFTVTGLPAGTRVRVATMDTFDGVVWNVSGGRGASTDSGSFARLPKAVDPASSQGDTVDYTVTIGDYRGVWIPSAGTEESVRVSSPDPDGADDLARRVLANRTTGTMAQVGGVREGTSYTVTTTITPPPAEDAVVAADVDAAVATPSPRSVPEKLAAVTAGWSAQASEGTAGAVATEIAANLRDGYYSDGLPGTSDYPSTSGHGTKRLTDLFDNQYLVGNDEQYASAMAVALQRLGTPARVVTGFRVPAGGAPVTGADVTAWVQVALDGLGWVDFTPTPDKDRILNKLQDTPDPQPQPQVLQPPEVPQEPSDEEDVAQAGGVVGQRTTSSEATAVPVVVWVAAGGVLLLLLPIALVLLLKALRRRRRRRAADPVDRLSGGWREIADRARELGTRLPSGNTRHENATLLTALYPVPELAGLAHAADAGVFGLQAPTDTEVAAYWADVATARRRMRRHARWRRRLLAPVSLASFGRVRLRRRRPR